MNAGTDYEWAKKQALANARTDNKPRYIHKYNGCYWIEREPPTPGPLAGYAGSSHTVVYPSGVYQEYDPTKGPPHEHPDRQTDPA
jgi:hypothetical protein